MLAGTDDHLTWLSPVILNLENMGLTHLESEIRVQNNGPGPSPRSPTVLSRLGHAVYNITCRKT